MERFSELEYQRPDLSEVEKGLKEQLQKLQNAASYQEVKEAYQKSEEIFGHFMTAQTISQIRGNMNTADEFYQKEEKFFNEASVKVSLFIKDINEALVNSAYQEEFANEFGAQIIKDMEADIRLNSDVILQEKVEEANLVSAYARSVAGCSTEFEGEKCNFYGLLKHMLNPDRDIRKKAMHAWSDLYASVADDLDEQYAKLCALRRSEAKKLGFNNYIEMAYLNMHRFDYGPKDVEVFREAVKKYIVPVCEKIYQDQAERLGIDKVKYYDETLRYKEGNPAPGKSTQEMIDAAQKMYSELSKETKEFFDFMVEHELFDLETRPNKHMGGYCTELLDYHAPFIYSNFNGTSADMHVLTHEAGHAFEAFSASRTQPLTTYFWSTSEVNEIHSMSMEFFTEKWYDYFYRQEDVEPYKYQHLIESITTIPYLVSVDEFQHRVFEGEEKTAAELREIWHEIEMKYLPWRDYDGDCFLEEGGFWMQKQHVFMFPFYYVDYALAMLCAMQFYLKMQDDFALAWKDYLHLCKLGGSLGYHELLKEANLKLPFDETTIREVTDGVVAKLQEMEAKQ